MNDAIIGLLVIVVLAGLAAWRLVVGKVAERPVKVMMFVGYFWLLVFVQLCLFAVIHYSATFFNQMQ